MERIEYPSWHDDARKLRAEGKSVTQIADIVGISANICSKITSASWKQYLLMYRQSFGRRKGTHLQDYNPAAYVFVPVEAKTPIQKEREYNIRMRHFTPKTEEPDVGRVREFETIKRHDNATNKLVMGYKVRCSKCNNTEEYISNKGLQPHEFVSSVFRKRGWMIGASPRADLCPTHATPMRAKPVEPTPVEDGITFTNNPPAKKEEPMQVPLPTPSPNMQAVAAVVSKPPTVIEHDPNNMGKTEKRIIFAKLNEVYQDEVTGYSGDWTDAKLAADLGVPVAWIAEVRSEDFGPETNAGMRAALSADMDKLSGRIESQIKLVDAKLEAAEKLDDKVSAALAEAKKSNDRLQELIGNLQTADAQTKEAIEGFNRLVTEYEKIHAEHKGNSSVVS